jgi:predicted metal-dependent hydrolase
MELLRLEKGRTTVQNALHLLVIYIQESFEQLALHSAPNTWRISRIALNKSHPMRYFRPLQLTEPLDGPDGDFLRTLINDRPDLLLLEGAPHNTPPHHLVHLMKTSAATRRIPIVFVVPSEGDLRTARQSAADQVISKDTWRESAAEVLAGWSARLENKNLATACAGMLHPLAAQGVEAVKAGEFYLAHELLEEAWMAVDAKEGILYRALLQVAVAYLQLERHNLRGALKMMLRMRQWLDPLPPTCRGIDVTRLRGLMSTLHSQLETLALDHKVEIHPDWLQPIPLAPTPPDAKPDPSSDSTPET